MSGLEDRKYEVFYNRASGAIALIVDNLIADIINGDEVIPGPESFIPIILSIFLFIPF